MIDNDPGLQPERTALAWQRSALACVLIAMTASVAALKSDVPAIAVLTGLVIVMVLVNLFRRFPNGGYPQRRGLHSWPILRRLALEAICLSILGCALAVTHLLR